MTRAGVISAGLVLLWAASCLAADEAKKGTVVKVSEGLKFQVPEDWPIEKRGGAVGPVPVEEYLAMKFAKAESQLENLQKQIKAQEERIRRLEEENRRRKQLQSGETDTPP